MIEKPIHIFVADDDPDDQILIQEALLSITTRCRFYIFDDGAQFAAYLQANPGIPNPAIFLIDHNMPKTSGIELLADLKMGNNFTQVTKMLWSTSFSEEIAERSKLLGVKAFFEKPNTSQGFNDIARQILKISDIT